jgi:hypothetical protein
MSNDEIIELLKLMPRPDKNGLWSDAFKEYNDDHKDEISLNCMPCYIKVRKYIIEKYALAK